LDGSGTSGGTPTGTSYTPVFINVAKTGYDLMQPYRKARPSSNHPGIAVSTFSDRSVRPLNENMSQDVFVRICQPHSGIIVDLKDIQ
jgi:hypothetical protein